MMYELQKHNVTLEMTPSLGEIMAYLRKHLNNSNLFAEYRLYKYTGHFKSLITVQPFSG